MLRDDDAALVARDRRLPGLAFLLDADAFAAAIRRAVPGAEIGRAEAFYLRYKPGTNCVCCYRVWTGPESTMVYAKAFAPGDPGLHKVHHPVVEGGLGAGAPGTILLAEQAVRMWAFPNDQRIRALARLGSDARRRRLLKRIVPDRPAWWSAGVEPLAYKPDRRFVGRLDVAGRPAAVLRLYTGAGFARAVARARFVAAAAESVLPAVHGISERHRAIVYGWIEGRSLLDDLLDGAFRADRFAAAGAALARLHRLAPGELPRQAAEDEASTVRAAAAEVAGLVPELAPRARALGEALAAELGEERATATVHGDFYPKQVVASPSGVGLIDLDAACAGDPGRDLGAFLAHLERYGLGGRIAAALPGPAGSALLDGYRGEGQRVEPARVRLQMAASLLRLASHPFRRREEGWRSRLTTMLEAAEQAFRDVDRLAAV